MRLSEELNSALVESEPDHEEEILGRTVRFFKKTWMEDGKEQASWSFEVDGTRSSGPISLLSIAREAARKLIEKLNKQRDKSGKYTHKGDWERMCKCGHPLNKHSSSALAGGMRDCFGCEEEGKPDSHHRFVEKKPKK